MSMKHFDNVLDRLLAMQKSTASAALTEEQQRIVAVSLKEQLARAEREVANLRSRIVEAQKKTDLFRAQIPEKQRLAADAAVEKAMKDDEIPF